MSIYYPSSYGYASKFFDAKMFRERSDAYRHDQGLVAAALYGLIEDDLAEAMRGEPDVDRFDRVVEAMRFFVDSYEDNKARLRREAAAEKASTIEPEPLSANAATPVDVESLPMPPRMVGADRGEAGEVTF